MKPYYTGEKPQKSQGRNVKGYFEIAESSPSEIVKFFVIIKDLFALEPGGLKQIILSVGLNDNIKTSLDDYKTSMDKAIMEKPYEFLLYALYDADVLFIILER